jgi:SAM-dependent methyltransferase
MRALANVYEQIKEVVPRRYRYLARAAWCDVMSPLFAGDAVECPICEKSSRRWISLGLDEGMCPRCMSEGRHRLLALYMRDELGIPGRRARILHFAAEYCFIRRFDRASGVTHIVADLDPPRGGVKMDITNIPLDSESVDLVICSHVLEHVEDDAKAMRELKRVLRPGGTALVMCPVSYELESTFEDPSIVTPEGRREAFHQSDHVRLYGADFDDRLRAAGFQVDASRYASRAGERVARYGLHHDEMLYACT